MSECEREDCQRIAWTASDVYCAITGGLLSYPTLVAERDSARDWAVALENRVELLSRLARNYHESVFEFCDAKRPELTADGFTVVCSLAAEHDGDHIFAEHSPFAAALTGGEDDARA